MVRRQCHDMDTRFFLVYVTIAYPMLSLGYFVKALAASTLFCE